MAAADEGGMVMAFAVDAKCVAAAEAKLGARLPLGYATSMRAENGGAVEAGGDVWQLHPIFDSSDRKRLKRTANDIVRETKVAAEWVGWPAPADSALAIGANGGGDRLILLREGDRFGDAVYWWDHETGEVRKVADDFSELRRA